MSSTLKLAILVVVFSAITLAAHKSHEKKHPNCQEFSQNVTFSDGQAVGTWHLLHHRKDNSSADPYCVEFTPVTDQERKELSNLLEKIPFVVENLKWENLTLKMQIPCAAIKSNRTRDYYLEKLEGDGSYRTLQMPPSAGTKLDIGEIHRYQMRLKMIEGQYLGMMDCHERFVFLLGKQIPEGKDIDDKLKKMIDMYWPDEM